MDIPPLLPCPFCARTPSLHICDSIDPPSGMQTGWQAHVQCMCGANVGTCYLNQLYPSARFDCMVEATERWNLRKQPNPTKHV